MPHPDWSSLELYVMEEHIEDYNLGFIGRRELLRKVTLITGSLAITLAVLPALGCNPAPTGTGASPAASSAANRTPSPTAVATAASTDFAIPPAARTTDGITVKADDPRIVAAAAQPKGAADGFAMTGYLARPKADGKYPGMLVIHENRGVTEHIRDVVRRAATAGFTALTIDLLSRKGGADGLGDAYSAEIAKTSPDAMVADLKAALDFLKAQSSVKADDARIAVAAAQPKGAPDGFAMTGYLARPKADGKYPGILVIHENRGVTEHIRDVVRRAATAGFTALTIDLLSRKGGADGLGDAYSAEIAKTSPDAMVADLKAALDFLKAQPSVKADALAVTGFCFGGGMVWSLLAAGGDLKAAAPFYGPIPQSPAGLGTTKAAVSAVYAETDTRITSTAPQIEELLKRAGRPYKLTTYPGVGHAFHNDTGSAYNADQAQKAWIATIQWFRQYAV